jgi:hypothetical protein
MAKQTTKTAKSWIDPHRKYAFFSIFRLGRRVFQEGITVDSLLTGAGWNPAMLLLSFYRIKSNTTTYLGRLGRKTKPNLKLEYISHHFIQLSPLMHRRRSKVQNRHAVFI